MQTLLDKIHVVQKLPENTQGNDYIIGDLHGKFSLLEKALEIVKFNPKVDRLFSVGDLADRGEDSYKCIKFFMDNDFCYPVMGNHEELLLSAAWELLYPDTTKPKLLHTPGDVFVRNGGMWALEHLTVDITDEFYNMLRYVASLPQIITVGENEKRFNIVHAELPFVWTDNIIDELPEYNTESYTYLRWSRLIFRDELIPSTRPDLSLTYCGHTIEASGHPAYSDSHFNIDTGAFLSNNNQSCGLTIVNNTTSEIHMIKDHFLPIPLN
jgi:serine/threonine protein phosphatase 1